MRLLKFRLKEMVRSQTRFTSSYPLHFTLLNRSKSTSTSRTNTSHQAGDDPVHQTQSQGLVSHTSLNTLKWSQEWRNAQDWNLLTSTLDSRTQLIRHHHHRSQEDDCSSRSWVEGSDGGSMWWDEYSGDWASRWKVERVEGRCQTKYVPWVWFLSLFFDCWASDCIQITKNVGVLVDGWRQAWFRPRRIGLHPRHVYSMYPNLAR